MRSAELPGGQRIESVIRMRSAELPERYEACPSLTTSIAAASVHLPRIDGNRSFFYNRVTISLAKGT